MDEELIWEEMIHVCWC